MAERHRALHSRPTVVGIGAVLERSGRGGADGYGLTDGDAGGRGDPG